jgi:cytidyltransferase-like protein
MAERVYVSGGFDILNSRQVRFLEEASKLGEVTVLLWADELIRRFEGKLPKFPFSERQYLLQAIRFVTQVLPVGDLPGRDALPDLAGSESRRIWAVQESDDTVARKAFCREHQLDYRVFSEGELRGFPCGTRAQPALAPGIKKVIVTGCYDWLHSGHVRFFEEVSTYGDLYVVLGHDANIRSLKGEGHPLFPQDERRYMVGAIRFVKQALIASGQGWIDADPEIQWLKPDIYAVNEDGDRGGKREYCAERGIEYRVLRREPAPGLARRSSTDLRGY